MPHFIAHVIEELEQHMPLGIELEPLVTQQGNDLQPEATLLVLDEVPVLDRDQISITLREVPRDHFLLPRVCNGFFAEELDFRHECCGDIEPRETLMLKCCI